MSRIKGALIIIGTGILLVALLVFWGYQNDNDYHNPPATPTTTSPWEMLP